LSEPVDFDKKVFEDFLRDELPENHADYVMGLISLAIKQKEIEEAWRLLLNE
jgi:hypothetical protein